MNLNRPSVAGYSILDKIGQGQFGKVWKGSKISDPSEIYAIKEVKKSKLKINAKLERCFHTEIEIMSTFEHPNILHCHDVIQDEDNYFLVLDFCEGGDLEHYIMNQPKKTVEEGQAVKWLAQV